MRINVSFQVEVPTTKANEDDIQEWLEYELNSRGGISSANPLCMTDIDAENVQHQQT